MFKKILFGVIFIGLLAALIWGGVNRTLAKTESSTDSYSGRNWDDGDQGTSNGSRRQGRDSSESLDEDHEDRAYRGQVSKNDPPDDDTLDDEYTPYDGGGRFGDTGRQGLGRGSGGSISDAEIEALHLALDDEYHALATCLSVKETSGNVEPFVSIALSEQRHIDALVKQFNKYGIPVPENSWIGTISPFDSINQACQVGVQAELANAVLYAELFDVIENQSLVRVFTNLSRASTESHLPEFQACQ